jgi:hypothetical protein
MSNLLIGQLKASYIAELLYVIQFQQDRVTIQRK